jgi:hypothetical protein
MLLAKHPRTTGGVTTDPAAAETLVDDVIRHIAEILLEHDGGSVPIVAFVSACKALRVDDVPVCTGEVMTRKQCEQLRAGSPIFSFVKACVVEKGALPSLVEVCESKLQSLSVGWHGNCWGLTDLSPLERCKRLRALNLTGCISLTDLSPLAGCESLHTLNLKGCTNVADSSLHYFESIGMTLSGP